MGIEQAAQAAGRKIGLKGSAGLLVGLFLVAVVLMVIWAVARGPADLLAEKTKAAFSRAKTAVTGQTSGAAQDPMAEGL